MRYRNLWISWCRHWRLLILISYAASFPTNRKLLVKYTLRQPPIVHVNLFLFTIPSFIALKVVKTLKNDIEQNFFYCLFHLGHFLFFWSMYSFIRSFNWILFQAASWFLPVLRTGSLFPYSFADVFLDRVPRELWFYHKLSLLLNPGPPAMLLVTKTVYHKKNHL